MFYRDILNGPGFISLIIIMESVVDLRQIRITPPIVSAVESYNPDIDLSSFKIDRDKFTTPLNRMENMMSADPIVIQDIPVKLVNVKRDGKNVGVLIDGTRKALYDIMDGRHRITRSIIDGNKQINAIISNSGGRKHKHRSRKRKHRSRKRKTKRPKTVKMMRMT
jgi:hypothetical protein